MSVVVRNIRRVEQHAVDEFQQFGAATVPEAQGRTGSLARDLTQVGFAVRPKCVSAQ